VTREIWKDVVGYEGIYQASNMGRVMRVAGGQGAQAGRMLKPWRQSGGYLQLALCRDGKRTKLYVHRLVAERFLGPAPSPKHEVNHKNGVKDDNRVENLEWVTKSENEKHAYRILGREPKPSNGEAHGQSKLTRRQVKEIRRLYATGEYTQTELGEMFEVSDTTISRIVRRKTWKHLP